MTIEQVAEIAHEANKVVCEQQGDYSQVHWELAPQWQKDSAVNGVKFKLDNPNATPVNQHEAWSNDKIADGWKWGPKKDVDKKEHHCLVPYDQLPVEQQVKDWVFVGIVSSLSKFIK